MFVDAYLNRKANEIRVVERINGQRVYNIIEPEYVFYYEHAAGTHQTIFGDACKKMSFKNPQKFRQELEKKHQEGKRIFESDINPVFRALANHYQGAEAPKLNIAFFDIETAFNPEKGFAPTDDPFNEITAISIYLKWTGQMVTLALCPPTLNIDSARRLCEDMEDIYVFNDERELLQVFIGVIDDVDVLSGWNCIDKSANVWLEDRIKPLGEVKSGDRTTSTGAILEYHESGMKRANRLLLANGTELFVSDEHRIPVMTKHPEQYKCTSSLQATTRDMTVAEIKKARGEGEEVFCTQKLRQNMAKNLTWRDLIDSELETLMSNETFDVALISRAIRDTILTRIPSDEHLMTFGNKRVINSPQFSPRRWKSKNFSFVNIDMVRDFVNTQSRITIVPKNGRPYLIQLDEPIHADLLALVGMLFTDGTRYMSHGRNVYRIYNTEYNMLESYKRIAHDHNIIRNSTVNSNVIISMDGCAQFTMSSSSVMGVLERLIYQGNKKSLNVELLSRLSTEQFRSLYAGFMDGDGCLSGNIVTLCNYEEGQPARIAELLLWNGVYATVRKNIVYISSCEINERFIRNLPLRHENKALILGNKTYLSRRNSPQKNIENFVFPDRAILRIELLEDAGFEIPMADIQTEGSYFHCGGIHVHNSTFYDIPYTVNRIKGLLGDNASQELCLWNERPVPRKLIRFKREFDTYDLVGRVHLDYLSLYQKHNPQQLHSYRLDYVGEIEVGENKTVYQGTLDELWRKDFRLFIEYNRQDTLLLHKIDEKKKFIELSNQVAHANCVLLKTTMGSVALVEQAIINDMHAMGFIVPDRKRTLDERDQADAEVDADDDVEDEEKTPVCGAYVADPKKGLHEHIACCDINSLYPSSLRAFNGSPETIVGQLRPDETTAYIEAKVKELGKAKRAEAWNGLFGSLEYTHVLEQDDALVTIDFEDGTSRTMTGRDAYAYIFNPKNHLCVTANGTIFSTKKDGMIPTLLAKWYSERKTLQKEAKQHAELAKGVTVPDNILGLLVKPSVR